MANLYDMVKDFKRRYSTTVCWRLKRHCKVIEMNLNPGEELYYAFPAQNSTNWYNFTSTCVVALSNKRILIGQKRLFWGYFFNAITPDLFNDFRTRADLFWGKAYIDTIKEMVILSNIARKALPEVEQKVTSYMMKEKQELFGNRANQTESMN